MKKSEQPSYTLGIDIGIASVGAALLAEDRIINLHVRTFDRAETAKEGESLNKIRRESRLTRRRIHRRALRLKELRQLFVKEGLVDEAEPRAFAVNESPWILRWQGLDRKLKYSEWAAVIYHIVKHRGFQSNRKSEAKEDEKAGQMLSGMNANHQLQKEAGYRTIGELAARHEVFAQAKRNKGGSYTHTFSRSDIERELKKLFTKQKEFGNKHAGKPFRKAVHALLMRRRPALAGDDLLKMVGRCTFEPEEFRAPKASYTAERFVWLTRLNNLRISQQGEIRALTDEERKMLVNEPFFKAKLTYKQIRKILDMDSSARFIGLRYPNTADGNKDPEATTIFEAKAFHALRKEYEKAGLKLEWQRDSQNPERLNTLAYAMSIFKDDAEASEWLQAQGIEGDIIEAILNVSFSQFIRLSIKALEKILPWMEQGLRYDEAVIKAGYEHHSHFAAEDKSRYIPRFSRDAITNPVVSRALNQARKLVNAIVREYGPPHAVHIELARELSKPFDERNRIHKEQEKYQKNKAADIEQFEEEFGLRPRGLQLVKYRLYREQFGKCAYSLRAIDLNRLLEDGYVEVDHALPYSRSFDNGMNNKVLALTAENRNKGNQTPYEFLDGKNNTEAWRNYEAAVSSNKNYRQAKCNNLLRKDFGEEAAREFRERHLTDTRYIAKEFKRMVETHLRLADESDVKRCLAVSGQLTAFLRARWGLLKVREDGDLHHALDAAVVAACSHHMVKRLSDYSRYKELEQARQGYFDPESGEVLDLDKVRQLEKVFPAPWPNFRNELLARLSPNPPVLLADLDHYSEEQAQAARPVRVSRAPTRRGLGAAHQETIRSAKHLDQGQSAVRTPLAKLKLKDLPNIVGYEDPRNHGLVTVIRERLEAHGDDGKKAFAEPLYRPSAAGKTSPLVRSVKLLATQKSGLSVRNGIANNGDMIRVDIFTDGKRFYPVPLYVADVVKDKLPNRAVVAYKPEDEWIEMADKFSFLFSLHPNDWVAVKFKSSPEKAGYFSGLNRATGAIALWAHDRNNNIGKKGFLEGIGIKTALDVHKYHVDFLGQLHRVHHEQRKPLNLKS